MGKTTPNPHGGCGIPPCTYMKMDPCVLLAFSCAFRVFFVPELDKWRIWVPRPQNRPNVCKMREKQTRPQSASSQGLTKNDYKTGEKSAKRRKGIGSALCKWGRTQMGSDGFNRILTGVSLFSRVGVRLVPRKTHDFKTF